MKKFLTLTWVLFFLLNPNFAYSEMYLGDSLEGKMIYCENPKFQDEITPKPEPFILSSIFIKFHGKDGVSPYGEKQYAAEISLHGVMPDDFYKNITVETPLVDYAVGSLTYSGESFLTREFYSYHKPRDFNMDDYDYPDFLFEYATTTDYIYLGAGTDQFHIENITEVLRNEWLRGESWVHGPGILISRETLMAKINYSLFKYGGSRRVKNEVIELKCNIHEEDLSDKYFQIERNHYDLVQDAHNRNREKELESTNNNLL